MTYRNLIAALALLAAPAIVWADPIYKSTMPDGRVIYGEEPYPGAQRVDKVGAPAASGAVLSTKDEQSRARLEAASGGAPAVSVIQKR